MKLKRRADLGGPSFCLLDRILSVEDVKALIDVVISQKHDLQSITLSGN